MATLSQFVSLLGRWIEFNWHWIKPTVHTSSINQCRLSLTDCIIKVIKYKELLCISFFIHQSTDSWFDTISDQHLLQASPSLQSLFPSCFFLYSGQLDSGDFWNILFRVAIQILYFDLLMIPHFFICLRYLNGLLSAFCVNIFSVCILLISLLAHLQHFLNQDALYYSLLNFKRQWNVIMVTMMVISCVVKRVGDSGYYNNIMKLLFHNSDRIEDCVGVGNISK